MDESGAVGGIEGVRGSKERSASACVGRPPFSTAVDHRLRGATQRLRLVCDQLGSADLLDQGLSP